MPGPYLLCLGDDDSTKTWGGKTRAEDPPSDHVGKLQNDLRALGFGLLTFRQKKSGDPPGKFGYWTAFAVREFQTYALAPWAAVDESQPEGPLAYKIVKKTNEGAQKETYQPPALISGVVNAETNRLIALWSKKKWRCPIMICGFSKPPEIEDGHFADIQASKKLLKVENAWTRFDHDKAAKYYYAIDYSGSIPNANGDLPDMSSGKPFVEGVGRAYSVVNARGYIGGPSLDRPQLSNPEAAITPERLMGPPGPGWTEPQKSTFRVIKAIANREAAGRFDALNGWDAQVYSCGPYQFALTASSPNGDPQVGEFPAFLAMLAAGSAPEREAFNRRFGAYGLGSDKAWSTLKPNDSLRTYASSLSFIGPMKSSAGKEQDPSAWTDSAAANNGFPNPKAAAVAAKESVRNWHMAYRLLLSARREPAIRTAYWAYCRRRLQNILSTPWGAMDDYPKWSDKPTTIGSVFRSEAAVAMLLRVHVKFPNSLARKQDNEVTVRDVLRDAIENFEYTDKSKHPDDWTLPGNSEDRLIWALNLAIYRAKRPKTKKKKASQTIAWDWIFTADLTSDCYSIAANVVETDLGPLKRTRDFVLDQTGL